MRRAMAAMLAESLRPGGVIVKGQRARTAAALVELGALAFRNAQAGGVQYVPTFTVRTWADGYGMWHADVTGSDDLAHDVSATAARAAIRAELDERGDRDPAYRVRVRYIGRRPGADHRLTTYDYREM